MKARNSFWSIAIASIMAISMVGCSTMVTIQSEPPGADIILNNQKVGTTPFAVNLSDFVFTSYDVTLKKDGYADYHGRLAKEAKVGAIIGGVFIGLPLLWCYGPQPYQTFYLSGSGQASGASVINTAERYAIRIDDIELGAEPMIVEAGTHTVTFVSTDGASIATTADFIDGYRYEFSM
ncbi:MAG TPA: PEGA domain-containing protein [Spirochaetia bacterium]|nr:PEGA domain-containing protein [Spirochaetia bacterium]